MAGKTAEGAKEAGQKLAGAARKTVEDPKGSAEEAARKAREIAGAVHGMAAELRAELARGGHFGEAAAEGGAPHVLQLPLTCNSFVCWPLCT